MKVRSFGFVMVGIAAMILAAYFKYPLPTPVPIPSTVQLLLVSFLGIFFGPLFGYLIVGIYLFFAAVGLPVFVYHFPHDQLAVFLYWWPGATIGYLAAIFVGGKIYDKVNYLSTRRLIFYSILVDLSLFLPHFLWQYMRVKSASIFVVVQLAAVFFLQILLIFTIRAHRSRRLAGNK